MSELSEREMARIRRAEAATTAHVARLAGECEVNELSAAAQRDVARLLQRIDEQRLADGRAVIVDGEVVSRELTAEEVASGRFPLARLMEARR